MDETEERSRQIDIPLPMDEEEIIEDAAKKAIEEEADGLQNLAEEAKRVKLPIDMLLGNPALAGKDVQCKVEKKIQNLGGGILSKTIMVICDDNEDQPEETKSEIEVRPLGPVGGSS